MKNGVCNKYKKFCFFFEWGLFCLLIYVVFFINWNLVFSCDKDFYCDNFVVFLECEVMVNIFRYGD